jgi:hypothetical protein
MTKAQAERMGAALVAAGVLEGARPGRNYAKANAAEHGPSMIEGRWTGRASLSGIACVHVAEALISAGRWTPAAVNACRHFGTREPARLAKRATAKRCTHTCEACRAEEAA